MPPIIELDHQTQSSGIPRPPEAPTSATYSIQDRSPLVQTDEPASFALATNGPPNPQPLPAERPVADSGDGSLLVRILTYFGFGRRATRSRKSFISMLWNLFWGFSQITVIIVFLVLTGTHFKSPSIPTRSELSACDHPLGIWAILWIFRVILSSCLAYWEYCRDRVLFSSSHPENGTPQQPQPNNNSTSPVSEAPQQSATVAEHPDIEVLPHTTLYSRLTLLSSLITLTWFLSANVLQYTSVNTCRVAAPHLWWLVFGILSIMYLMVLEVVVLGFVVLVVAPILFIFWNIFLFAINRHPMQHPNAIKPDIGKLSKAAVDKIPLVLYVPAPPSDPKDSKEDIHKMPHLYPPKLQKRTMRFRLLPHFKGLGYKSKEGDTNGETKGSNESQTPSDSWIDKWEESEYPFVTLEGNRAACAICLMDYEEPKRKLVPGGAEDEKDQSKAPETTSVGEEGPSMKLTDTNEIVQEGELKLADAGQGSQPLRLLGCGHVFHKTCIDPWLIDVSGRCPVCQRPVEPTKPHESRPLP